MNKRISIKNTCAYQSVSEPISYRLPLQLFDERFVSNRTISNRKKHCNFSEKLAVRDRTVQNLSDCRSASGAGG
jgi:hypothetical protein